ncbi:MAG: EAL domain-containing protein [Leptospiraceae bacterium]|nr:EAL domain-containing protein [Leptospiraceae bacterium]
MRWLHPTRGWISPLQFIPIAEHSGLIVEIGNWVLEEACRILRRWQDSPATASLTLAVNVSARQFRQESFVGRLKQILQTTGARPEMLKLELTESLALENIEDTVAKMQELHELGIGLALDDFGTGHSSLSYLRRLPLHELKIDQVFVRDIPTDPNDTVLVQTIIGMAQNLRLATTAEGVETAEQLEFLKNNGCMFYQGFLFSPPLPQEEFEQRFAA